MSVSESISLKNDLAELERLSQLVADFGRTNGFTAEEQNAIHLCLEELSTNIISYAWSTEEEHSFDVRLTCDEQLIKVEIEDDGKHFDPTGDSNPDTTSEAADRPIGGLGIHLVKNTMSSL